MNKFIFNEFLQKRFQKKKKKSNKDFGSVFPFFFCFRVTVPWHPGRLNGVDLDAKKKPGPGASHCPVFFPSLSKSHKKKNTHTHTHTNIKWAYLTWSSPKVGILPPKGTTINLKYQTLNDEILAPSKSLLHFNTQTNIWTQGGLKVGLVKMVHG